MQRIVFRWAGRLRHAPSQTERESRARFVGGAGALLASASVGMLMIGASMLAATLGCEPHKAGLGLANLPIMVYMFILGLVMLAFAKAVPRSRPTSIVSQDSRQEIPGPALEQASRHLVRRCSAYGALAICAISTLPFAWRVANEPACWIPLATALGGALGVLAYLAWARRQDIRRFAATTRSQATLNE